MQDNIMEIIYLVRCGDTLALQKLYEHYYYIVKKIVGRIYHFQQGLLEKEDLMQIGMLAFSHILYAYREDRMTNFNTYVGVCVVRRIQSAIRQNDQQFHQDILTFSLDAHVSMDDERLIGETVADPHAHYAPAETLRRNDVWLMVDRFLEEKISARDRMIFTMYKVGYLEAEIARELDVPIKTVYNAVYRIFKKMQKEQLGQGGH